MINLTVNDDNQNKRVDFFISSIKKDISRSKIKILIEKGFLKINNIKILEPSKRIKLNDKIQLELPESKKLEIKPYKYKLNIVYEDNDILVINKPSGLVVHPGAGNTDNTLVNALIHYDKKNLSSLNGELRPGIVHRIDKDTSGLLVVAKNDFAHAHLSKQFSEHTIERKYILLVWGKLRPQAGKIKTFITRSSKNRQLMTVSLSKGKFAITNYKTIELFENENSPTLSLLECKLETGRTHQIRVHMTYKGNPILGDRSYKKKLKQLKNIDEELNKIITKFNRQCLHAKSLGFKHPITNKNLFFETELPKDINEIVQKLRIIGNY
jgi:23S rRNA pseudouridine1911/1915/1917 synthase|tara:strand:- start:18624 stop:19598 length:975 start_codon:yes stop_codon:yes gene_type:complete